jgi:hypothetical protein
MRVSLVSASLIVLGCVSVATGLPPSADSLAIEVEVKSAQVEGAWHSIVNIRIRNVSRTTVAVSDTFGITNEPWLSLEIEDASGKRIFYPSEIDTFDEIPKYECLRPGDALEVQIDLMRWHPTFGALPAKEVYAFELAPGRYRLRALYSDRRDRVHARCSGIESTASSGWRHFEVQGGVGKEG